MEIQKQNLKSLFNFNEEGDTDSEYEDIFMTPETPYNSPYNSENSENEKDQEKKHDVKHTCETSDEANFCDCNCKICCDYRYEHGFLYIDNSKEIRIMTKEETKKIVDRYNKNI